MPAEDHPRRDEFTAFATAHVAPHAATADRLGVFSEDVVGALAGTGYLGAAVGASHGGGGMDERSFGVLCEEIGRVCTATRSLLTVQNMVGRTIERWGTAAQRERWLPALATGDVVAAFCLTEPQVGSDAKAVQTELVPDAAGGWLARGRKRWVTFGARADVFLVLGRNDTGPTAFLAERAAPGVSVEPVHGQLGLRGAMLGDVAIDGVEISPDAVVGKPGWGFSHVVSTTLDHGRFSVASGCVGMAQAALDDSVRYALAREQFGVPIVEHQLVRAMVAEMLVGVRAARLLCADAAALRDAKAVRSVQATMLAKYHAARMLASVTSDAVQIHGANGVGTDHAVERYFRDSKVMQIIEGSDQMLQIALSDVAYRTMRSPR